MSEVNVRAAVGQRNTIRSGERQVAVSAFPLGWAACLVACWLLFPAPVGAVETVRVGSKSFTEQVILGEMITQLLRDAGLHAEHRADLGGTQILFKALLAGDLDVYVEYTGTMTQEIFSGKGLRDEDMLRRELARSGIVLAGRLGFANNYALGIREELAQKYQIRSIADLARYPELRVGVSDEFYGRRDGWPALVERYGLPHKPRVSTHEVALRALASGKLDVTDLFTTDAEIRQNRLLTLEDERGALAVQHAVLLYRADLEQRAPEAVTVLRRLVNLLDNDTMVDRNARVRIDGKTETLAAAELLNDRLGLNLDLDNTPSRLAILAGIVYRCTWQHLGLVLVSLSLAVVVAIPLGVLAFRYRALGQVILGLVGIVQTIPSMALLVGMIPLLGLGVGPALVALLLYSLLPIVRNTYNGLVEIPQGLRESAEVLGLPARARLWRIELPLASRSILAGIKTAAVINVGTATIGALIGAGGYGQPILTGIRLNDIGLILVGTVPAALLALLMQQVFGWLEIFVVPRGLRVS